MIHIVVFRRTAKIFTKNYNTQPCHCIVSLANLYFSNDAFAIVVFWNSLMYNFFPNDLDWLVCQYHIDKCARLSPSLDGGRDAEWPDGAFTRRNFVEMVQLPFSASRSPPTSEKLQWWYTCELLRSYWLSGWDSSPGRAHCFVFLFFNLYIVLLCLCVLMGSRKCNAGGDPAMDYNSL